MNHKTVCTDKERRKFHEPWCMRLVSFHSLKARKILREFQIYCLSLSRFSFFLTNVKSFRESFKSFRIFFSLPKSLAIVSFKCFFFFNNFDDQLHWFLWIIMRIVRKLCLLQEFFKTLNDTKALLLSVRL